MGGVTATEDRFAATALGRLRTLTADDGAGFRDGQLEAIHDLVVDRARVLCVQRTGWGKSAVYFVATALLRERGAGPTLVVSPLLALMRDQIAAARRAGIAAETVNSANTDDWDEIHERIAAGTVDLLVVSPERLNSPAFRDGVLPRLTAEVGLLVVDEAHCISDWGHDFRPDYRRIRDVLAGLGDVPVLACTATANDRVVVVDGAAVGAGGGFVREGLPVPAAIGGLPAENWANFDFMGVTQSGRTFFTGDTAAMRIVVASGLTGCSGGGRTSTTTWSAPLSPASPPGSPESPESVTMTERERPTGAGIGVASACLARVA